MSETNDIEEELAKLYRRMLAEQTPIEPEFAAAIYRNRSELYTLLPAPIQKGEDDGRA